MRSASIWIVCAALAAPACGDSGSGAGGAGGSANGGAAEGGSGGGSDADADGDFLSDTDEESLGTDPSDPDTDDDGYLDGDEVLEETDPLDPESKIYEGGWPYQREKDQIEDPGFGGVPSAGAVLPRLIASDQYGQIVDLYDFSLHGKPIVIDLSALWCDACKELAAWLEGEPSMLDDNPDLAPVRDLVDAGEVYWVTVIFEDAFGAAAGPEHAVAWADEYPNPTITVLADDDRAMFTYMFPGGYPFIAVVDEDMTISFYDRFDYESAMLSLL